MSETSKAVRVGIEGVFYSLTHVPDLVRYGSKPSREIRANPSLVDELSRRLRSVAPCQLWVWDGITKPDEPARLRLKSFVEVESLVRKGALPLYSGNKLVGACEPGHTQDANLTAEGLLENLAAKVTAAHSLRA